MNWLVIVLLFLISCVDGQSTTVIHGNILMSKKWENQLYIFRVDDIDPMSPHILTDTVTIDESGNFNFHVEKNPTSLLYKARIVPKGANAYTFISGAAENYFLFTIEGNENVKIEANADSLFFSYKVLTDAPLNKELTQYRNAQIEYFKLSQRVENEMQRYPENVEEIRKKNLSQLFETAEGIKSEVDSLLLVSENQSSIVAGLHFNLISNFGKVDTLLINSYVNKLDTNLTVYSNLKKLAANSIELIGKSIGNLYVENQEANSMQVKEYLNHTYTVIDFWASWCSPCRQANKSEIPAFIDWTKKNNLDVQFIGFSLDSEKSKWHRAMAQDKVFWEQLIDANDIAKKMLQIASLPHYLIVDKEGFILYEHHTLFRVEQYLKKQVNN